MKYLNITSSIIFAWSLFLWVQHGSRVGFWKTSVETKKQIPIIDGFPEYGTQEVLTWEDKFICGIETPILGLLTFLITIIFSYIYKKRKLLKNL